MEREIIIIIFNVYTLFFQPTYRFADYFTVGCKTEDGFTVILVERGPGVETKPIKTSYSATAGTAYITFDNVRVPIGNTLGEEGGGIFVILKYFSSFESLREPWTLRGLSSNFIHEHSQASKLAGQIAFLKSYSTVSGQDTARDAVQSRNHTDWNGQIN